MHVHTCNAAAHAKTGRSRTCMRRHVWHCWGVGGALLASLAGPTGTQNQQRVHIKPTARAQKAENGSARGQQKQSTMPVAGAPGGGFACYCCLYLALWLLAALAGPTAMQNQQHVPIKPTARAHKAETGSAQGRQKQYAMPVGGAPGAGFTCDRCLLRAFLLPACLAGPSGTQNQQLVHIEPTARADKAESGSAQRRQKQYTMPVGWGSWPWL